MLKIRGFTLIELMIVVVVIAILAAVGYPSYANYVKRGKIMEAVSGLSTMRVTMERFFQDNRNYTNGCGAGAGTSPPLPANTSNFTFSCTTQAGPPAGYDITATGIGSMAGFIYKVDESNVRTTAAVPTGWQGSGNACWVLKSDGSC